MDAPDGANGRRHRDRDEAPADDLDADALLSSPADIESAGRSCMAILVLAAVILLLLCVWIGLRSTGAGQ
jgi:cobalamin biosynthesis Mg chelatase CobN